MRRFFDPHIKSLVHFDFPYAGQNFDGGRDEILGDVWAPINEDDSFIGAGHEIPVHEIRSDCPKFGYRCLRSRDASSFIATDNSSGNFSIDSSKNYEFECWVMLNASTAGNIVAFMAGSNPMLTLSVTASKTCSVTSELLGLNLSGSQALTLGSWTHLLVRLKAGTASLFVNGVLDKSASYSNKGADKHDDGGVIDDVYEPSLDWAGISLAITQCRLGGFNGYMDEFVLRDTAGSAVSVPTQPYSGYINLQDIGGWGAGTQAVTVSGTTFANSHSIIQSVNGSKISIGNVYQGALSNFTAGSEILIHVTAKKSNDDSLLGMFAFKKILNVSGQTLTLDSTVSEFSLEQAVAKYYVQIVAVVQALSVNVTGTLTTKGWDTTSGGAIIAIRSRGDFNLTGTISVMAKGPLRSRGSDSYSPTHYDLPDRFIIPGGGGIFIACGGTFTAKNGANIGGGGKAGWGSGSYFTVGSGSGSFQNDTNGGVGVALGDNSSSGGLTRWEVLNPQLTDGGGSSRSGPAVILIARKLALDDSALLTGGKSNAAGNINRQETYGSGSGLVYIACKEV